MLTYIDALNYILLVIWTLKVQVDNMLALWLFNNIFLESWPISFYCLHSAVWIFLIIMLLHFKAAASLACSALIQCIKIVSYKRALLKHFWRWMHENRTCFMHTHSSVCWCSHGTGPDCVWEKTLWTLLHTGRRLSPPLPPLSVPFSPAPSLSHAERQAALTMNQSCVERFDCRWG